MDHLDTVNLTYEPPYHKPLLLHHLTSHQSLQTDSDPSYKLTPYGHLKRLMLTMETLKVPLIDSHKYAPQYDAHRLMEYHEQMLKLLLH